MSNFVNSSMDLCYWEIEDATTDDRTLLRIIKALIQFGGQLISSYKFGNPDQFGDFWRREERLLAIIALPDGLEADFENHTGLDLRTPITSEEIPVGGWEAFEVN